MKASNDVLKVDRDLTISEKLQLFRQKKDESMKENDCPAHKSMTTRRPPTITSNIPRSSNAEIIPLERRKSFANTAKSANQSIPTSKIAACTSKGQATISGCNAKVIVAPALPKERVVKAKTRIPTPSEFRGKLDEYTMLAQTAGIEIARSFIETVPSESNMKDVQCQVLYWLTWIRQESEAAEWEYVTTLFSRSKDYVKTLSGIQAIKRAEEKFLSQLPTVVLPITGIPLRRGGRESICSDKGSPIGAPICDDVNDADCNDVRLLMGEDGFSLGELSNPKALRFSMGDPAEFTTLEESDAVKSKSSEVSTRKSAISLPNGSMDVCQLNNPVGDSSIRDDHITDISEVAVQIYSSTRRFSLRSDSLIKKSAKKVNIKSPGGASLDILLGIGIYDDADDEIDVVIPILNCVQSAMSSTSSLSKMDDAMSSNNGAVSVNTLLSGAGANVGRAFPGAEQKRRGRGAQRVKIGSADIFSDDEEEVVVTKNVSSVSASTRKRNSSAMIVDDIVTINNSQLEKSRESVDDRVDECLSKKTNKRRSILKKTAVSFAVEAPAVSPKVSVYSFEEDFNLVIDAFNNTVLNSGCRRSRRLSGPMGAESLMSSGSSVPKKNPRKGTPRAAVRPRFNRPSECNTSSSRSSEGSGCTDTGYGSYFSGMEGSPQFGDVDDVEFDLMENTPIVRERRSQRLSICNR